MEHQQRFFVGDTLTLPFTYGRARFGFGSVVTCHPSAGGSNAWSTNATRLQSREKKLSGWWSLQVPLRWAELPLCFHTVEQPVESIK